MSLATPRDGSRLLIGDASTRTPALGPSRPFVSTWNASLKSIGYWAACVAFCAWAAQCDHYYLMNGWWMVLLFFWLTASDASPAHLVAGRGRVLAVGGATVAAAFLIYGTFEWCGEILDGWSWGPPGQWLRLVTLPVRAIAGSFLTALVVVPLLRRHFGSYSAPLLVVAALPVGIADFGAGLLSATHWHEHWKASCIELFIVIILPLSLAAASERLKSRQWATGRLATAISPLWHGHLPYWVALVIVYPVTIAGVLWLISWRKDLFNHGYSNWQYATHDAIAQLLIAIVLVVGSVVTWRCFKRSAKKGRRSARWLQGIVVLIAAPYLLCFVCSEGFAVGNVITGSVKAALGSAYDFRVLGGGAELELSGDVTYGLADRLEEELKDHPSILSVRLDSGGGKIGEAMQAAKIIAAHKLDTVVGDECLSACTVMFVAGKKRTLEEDGKLGFHAARSADPTKHLFGSFRGAYAPFGVDRRFVARVEAFEPPALWNPTREELLAAGVLSK